MNKIIQFQTAHGLIADGVIGKNTITKMMEIFKIDMPSQAAHFLGQIHHETGGFTSITENLNYSPKRLRDVFPKYFPSVQSANKYGNLPESIANRVYANRMGNGDERSGDGWKFRGAGALQLTGRSNYLLFESWLKKHNIWQSGKDMLTAELIAKEYYWETALFYFAVNGLWNQAKYIDEMAIKSITFKINGGLNGLADRVEKTNYYYKLLN